MKIINNNPQGYAELRNINFFENNSLESTDDVFSLGNKLKHKLTGKGYNVFYKGLFYSIKDQNTPCHFFNSINLGKNPWIVTYETIIPRLGKGHAFWYKLAVKKLANPNCKKIIALSQCTFNRQIEYLKLNYPTYLDAVQKKMVVMHPPQDLLINNYVEKPLSPNSIVFTIVGADFFRKGGREVLNVFNELIPLYPQLKLNVISSLLYNDYASRATDDDYKRALDIIRKFPDNIVHNKGLPNSEVLSILRKSDVGLLPSWGDSYGYSVLESQAAGCPVITTNLRSFPEINNNKIGWLLELPLNNEMDADIDTIEKRIIFQRILEDGLKKSVLEILAFPDLIKEKGQACIKRIKEEHSLVTYKERLLQMYNENFKDQTV